MSDVGELLIPTVNSNISTEFREATSSLKRVLVADASKEKDYEFAEILNKVYTWEETYREKVEPDEISSLEATYSVLSTLKDISDHINTDPERARLAGVRIEQDILKTVFENLDENGRPNRVIARSFSLITTVFEKYLSLDSLKIKDPFVYNEVGLWQGIRGAVTTALMFTHEGWEVRLPPEMWDVRNEVDLIVRNKEGRIYTVDITSKIPVFDKDNKNLKKCFYLKKKGANPVVRNLIKGVSGTIRINVPPLSSMGESESFYEDRMTGYPSEEAFEMFGKEITS